MRAINRLNMNFVCVRCPFACPEICVVPPDMCIRTGASHVYVLHTHSYIHTFFVCMLGSVRGHSVVIADWANLFICVLREHGEKEMAAPLNQTKATVGHNRQ